MDKKPQVFPTQVKMTETNAQSNIEALSQTNDHIANSNQIPAGELAAAEEILAKDLFKAEKSVIRLINSPLNENQFAALVSFTFNIGGAALQRSTLRQKINYGNHQECSYEFLRWVYAGGKKIPGLILRRHAESKLFLNSDISIFS